MVMFTKDASGRYVTLRARGQNPHSPHPPLPPYDVDEQGRINEWGVYKMLMLNIEQGWGGRITLMSDFQQTC